MCIYIYLYINIIITPSPKPQTLSPRSAEALTQQLWALLVWFTAFARTLKPCY